MKNSPSYMQPEGESTFSETPEIEPVSWTNWSHSTPSHPTALRLILILSFNLRLGS
jgi:hypothetical protein